jgi:hypothetical protein
MQPYRDHHGHGKGYVEVFVVIDVRVKTRSNRAEERYYKKIYSVD